MTNCACYTSAFRHQKHYVFQVFVLTPIVQLTDWLTICPSIWVFSGHYLRNTEKEWPKIGMLLYPDHLKKEKKKQKKNLLLSRMIYQSHTTIIFLWPYDMFQKKVHQNQFLTLIACIFFIKGFVTTHPWPIDSPNEHYQYESIICINMLTMIENYYIYWLKRGENWQKNLLEID